MMEPSLVLSLPCWNCYFSWPPVWSALEFVKMWVILAIPSTPIWGTTEFFDQFLSSCLAKVAASYSRQNWGPSGWTPFIMELFWKLQDSPPPSHSAIYCNALIFGQFDLNLKTCLSCVLQCSLPFDSWCRATLPFSLGGLGLHSSYHSAAATFLSIALVYLLLSFCQ